MSFNLKCIVGTEPGEVRVTTIDVDVIDGRLKTGFRIGGHQISEGAELAFVATESIRGWGKVDSDLAYVVKSTRNEMTEVCIPDHEFERIGFDPTTLRRYDKFEMVYKSAPVYHANGKWTFTCPRCGQETPNRYGYPGHSGDVVCGDCC